jgi:hypothetical protein
MKRAEEDKLAHELLHYVTMRLGREGLMPDDPLAGRLIIAMLAGHYAVAGGDRYALTEQLHEQLDVVDEARRGLRHDIPGVKR